jgi:hypothetical protein
VGEEQNCSLVALRARVRAKPPAHTHTPLQQMSKYSEVPQGEKKKKNGGQLLLFDYRGTCTALQRHKVARGGSSLKETQAFMIQLDHSRPAYRANPMCDNDPVPRRCSMHHAANSRQVSSIDRGGMCIRETQKSAPTPACIFGNLGRRQTQTFFTSINNWSSLTFRRGEP